MYNDLAILFIGIFLIVMIFLVIFIPSTTNKINPHAVQLSQENLTNSLRRQEYKIKQNLQNNHSSTIESQIIQDIMHDDTVEKIYENTDWKNTKNIKRYVLADKIILVIPDIVFTLNDWNFLQSKKVKRVKSNGVELTIHKQLLQWTEDHPIRSELKEIESDGIRDLYILSYHSGCFLAYGLYCLLENVKQVKMFGPAKFFDFNDKHRVISDSLVSNSTIEQNSPVEFDDQYSYEIEIFVSLSDIWSKLPLQETATFWGDGVNIALNENSYKDFDQFKKI